MLGASLGLAAILAHSAVDFNMHIPANAILAITLMALLSSHLRFATELLVGLEAAWEGPVASGWCWGVVFLGLQGWRQAAEYVRLERAGRAPGSRWRRSPA